jgi:hypothetical protein
MRFLSKTGLTGIRQIDNQYIKPVDAIYTESVIIPSIEMDKIEYTPNSMFGGQKRSMFIDDWAKTSFEINLAMPTVEENITDLFAISNIIKESDGKFYPKTQSDESMSFDITSSSLQYQCNGAKGVFSLSGETGGRVETKFAISSGVNSVSQGEYTVPVAEPMEFLILKSATAVTISGKEVNLLNFSFEMGNELSHVKSTKSNEFFMKDYNPRVVIKAQMDQDNHLGFDELINATQFEISLSFADKNGDIKAVMTIPKASLDEVPTIEDNEGLFVLNRAYSCLSTNGDDNFNIEYIVNTTNTGE